MVKVEIKSKKQPYSWKTGVLKTLKNVVIMFAPAILAFLANVPVEYAPVASALAYFVKNWVENRNN